MTSNKIAHLAVALDTGDWKTFEGWCELFGGRVEVLCAEPEAFEQQVLHHDAPLFPLYSRLQHTSRSQL